MNRRIAVVEDDPEFSDYLKQLLEAEGYAVALYATPGRFLDALLKSQPDAALIDVQLPGMDGREVIRVLRANPETRGMILVAVSGRQKDLAHVVSGFHAGADEYFVKPVDAELLIARLGSLLRREETPVPAPERSLRLGDLLVLPERRECSCKGKPLKLTRLEFDLLVYFMEQRNRVLTRTALLDAVWKGDPTMNTRTVDKHVETLRRKLGPAGALLETVVRIGYVLKA